MNKRKIKKAKSAMKGYAFIGLNLIGVLIFWTVPMLFSFIISISKWDYSKGIKGIRIQGFSNYVEMWRDAWFRASLINNIVFTVSYVAVLIVLSFMVAYVLNEYVIGKKFVQLGLYLPYIVNIVAISAVWLALFSNNGPILNLLRKIGMENPPVFVSDLRWALPAIVLICIWQNLGYTVILFLSGMINVPRDLYEAAAIDGANGIARIWYVTIPMLSGTTFFIVITSIINSFKVFGLINLMTHGGPGTATTMLVYNIYRTAFQFGKLEFASAQGIVLLAIIFFITWIQFRIQKRNEA
ncbi:carbohydrate ABC transporter permease [Enterocloster clostridioformis]|jgi:multiple sugar transport system permease protein|uniref:Binding-protein-dependent transport system inner membrane protein n=1 Tax=Enterocloster clostridioformis TaxID=1531 RepID=A0A174EIZ7_9FIRM|nr:sugar ABC transporter permease [Enterocloster clostridioformis]CUX73919.1 Lactose transport system permease protein LacF [Clostridium sp. C105KSO14]MCA5578826.1 sugar ABC transporter permease [Enterocloster clostridioformis]MCF2702795.1 sugar ABC transporter permease [Enterocloster clostridioformis]MCI7607959.1 sugar ABC transporter permease [Enterocloster clostridioformis]MDB2130183.1 sugar ABC transporter permease [Enterocloster clostridioformis]